MMNRFPSLLAAVACFMPLSACANMDGDWPSLKTPAEQRAGTCDNLQVAMADPRSVAALQQAGGAQPPQAPQGAAAPAVDAAAVAARLAEEIRDFQAAQTTWSSQRTATEAAVNAARTAAPASEAWATAQLELTRLNQAAARFDQIRERVALLTGDLARLAAGGADVSAPLAEAGRLLARIDESAATHQATVTPLQASMPR